MYIMRNPVHFLDIEYQDNIKYNNRGTLIEAHIADIHFAAFDPKKQYTILMEQFIAPLKTLPKLDIISINGDIFDHKVLSSSDGALYASYFINEAVNLAREKNAVLILIHGTGSHDSNQLKLFYHYLNDVSVDVRIITSIQFQYIKNAKILCIPEVYGISDEFYKRILFNSGTYDSVFMHGTIEGAVYNNNVTGHSKLFSLNDFIYCKGPIISGHVHTPTCLHGYCYYSGSPYPWTFSDDHQKGFLIVVHNLDTGYHYTHFQPIISYNYSTIEINELISDDPKYIIDYINNIKIQKNIDYMRVKFNIYIPGEIKTIINSFFLKNEFIKIEYEDVNSINPEIELLDKMDNFSFLIDKSISDENKFIEYCNIMEGYEFITLEKLNQILNDEF